MLDWDDVRYLLAVKRGGTLARAARTLRTNATTVGRRLTALEERLGTRLFDRTARGWTPTEAGLRVLPHAERMEQEALSLERVASTDDPRLQGVVHLTTTEALSARYLTPHLPRLRERHPGIDLLLSCAERRLDLSRREADLALRLQRPEEPDVVARRVARIELALYASAGYLERRGRPDAPPPSFSGHDVLAMFVARATRPENDWVDQNCSGARVVLRSNSIMTLLDATREGLGCCLLPRTIAERDPRLVRLDTPSPPAPRDVWLAYHRDIEPSSRVRAVMDFLTEVLGPAPR